MFRLHHPSPRRSPIEADRLELLAGVSQPVDVPRDDGSTQPAASLERLEAIMGGG